MSKVLKVTTTVLIIFSINYPHEFSTVVGLCVCRRRLPYPTARTGDDDSGNNLALVMTGGFESVSPQ